MGCVWRERGRQQKMVWQTLLRMLRQVVETQFVFKAAHEVLNRFFRCHSAKFPVWYQTTANLYLPTVCDLPEYELVFWNENYYQIHYTNIVALTGIACIQKSNKERKQQSKFLSTEAAERYNYAVSLKRAIKVTLRANLKRGTVKQWYFGSSNYELELWNQFCI